MDMDRLMDNWRLVPPLRLTVKGPHPNGKPKWQHVHAQRIESSGFIMDSKSPGDSHKK